MGESETHLEHHAEIEEGMERIFTALDGPLVERLDGTVARDRSRGLVYQSEVNGVRLENIEHRLNDGIKTRLSRPVSGSIITACGMVVAATLPLVINWLNAL